MYQRGKELGNREEVKVRGGPEGNGHYTAQNGSRNLGGGKRRYSNGLVAKRGD